MLNKIHIENFKSIKKLDFIAKKINILIGEPNAGKSNILEALSFFCIYTNDLRNLIRFKDISNIFYDNEITDKIIVKSDKYISEFGLENNQFYQTITQDNKIYKSYINHSSYRNFQEDFIFDLAVKLYKFKVIDKFNQTNSNFLSVPYGDDMYGILRTNKKIREIVSDIFKEKGFRLNLRSTDNEIELVKEKDDILYSYPYQSISDTLQRVVFYLTVIMTNKNSTLLLEEPEANTFPFYTKQIAEQIALDDSNQYFIVTHNPYFLLSVIEKTNINDLALYITYMDDFQTKLKLINSKEMKQFLEIDSDIFFNLNKFIKK